MADNSRIEWTDATWNPIRARNRVTGKVGWFCVHASPGCVNCYAEGFNRRLGTGVDFKAQLAGDVELFLDEAILSQPQRWRRPRKIFVGSMTDLFGEFVPDWMIDRIWAVMTVAQQHTFQVLTKRAARMKAYVRDTFGVGLLSLAQARVPHPAGERALLDLVDVGYLATPLPNVWLGVSAEDQPRAEERVWELMQTPAIVRFVSAEPLLGPIDFARLATAGGGRINALSGKWATYPLAAQGPLHTVITADLPPIDGVIAGGESGPKARPMHPEWARKIRDDCDSAGVAFFFKQWGEWAPHRPVAGGDLGADVRAGRVIVVHPSGRDDVAVYQATGGRNTEPGTRYVRRAGKKAAGRLLDGRTHDALPFTPSAARAA